MTNLNQAPNYCFISFKCFLTFLRIFSAVFVACERLGSLPRVLRTMFCCLACYRPYTLTSTRITIIDQRIID
jgi:hypothetical protein